MHCSVKASAPTILKKMLEADGIILGGTNYIKPNYFLNDASRPFKPLHPL
jgi:multimeric flavodoxin WrbA